MRRNPSRNINLQALFVQLVGRFLHRYPCALPAFLPNKHFLKLLLLSKILYFMFSNYFYNRGRIGGTLIGAVSFHSDRVSIIHFQRVRN